MRHALYLERTQAVRQNAQLAATFAMGVNDPTPAISGNGAAIAPRPAGSMSLSAMISQYFIGGMMPESANPVQQRQTIIEIRPYRRRLAVL